MFILTFAVIGLSVFFYISGMKTTLLFLSVFLSAALFGQQMTYVPDDNFEELLEDSGDPDANWMPDDSVETSILESMTYFQTNEGDLIFDFTGLEDMVNLEDIYIGEISYQIQVLPTLYCPNLITAYFANLYLFGGYLDLSNCPNLEYLDMNASNFIGLDVNGLTSLTFIDAYLTNVYELDVSTCSALTTLIIDTNEDLTCLNVANGNNENFITFLYSSSGNLSCVTVDDPIWANENWNYPDPNGFPALPYSLNCGDACSCETITTQQEVISCNSYFWDGSGQTYSESGQYTENLLSQYGCDSIATINLTINQPSQTIHSITVCDDFTWIDGNTYTSSNNSATFLTTNSAGCDSVITLDLTINTTSIGTDVQEICNGDEYTWIDGNVYTEPNNSATYTMVGNAANGCDSIVTLNLSVISVPEPTIIQNENILSCDNFATAYQWLDCDDNYAPIEGATDMVFTANQNGSYALEITFDACSDTSDCYDIDDFVGISELNSTPKQIVKIIDLMGRETSFKPNTPLIYVYDDGSIEKVFSVEY